MLLLIYLTYDLFKSIYLSILTDLERLLLDNILLYDLLLINDYSNGIYGIIVVFSIYSCSLVTFC